MPLVASLLQAEIQKFCDPDFAGFVGFPETDLDTAAAWADAVDAYTGAGSFVTPPSTSGVAAKAALLAGLAGVSAPGAAVAIFDVAFLAYASALATGMAPAFVATPPPVNLSLTPPTILTVFAAGVAGADGATQALAMATLIDVWFKTGTATPAGGGPATLWV